jgi:organic radical activating enzyme
MQDLRVSLEIAAGGRTFATGLLAEIAAALQRLRDGDLLAIVGQPPIEPDLRTWSALTGHAIVASRALDEGGVRWVIRRGPARGQEDGARTLGSRLWLYTNFDCNLRCDYCCVRSSPAAARRALGLDRVRRIAAEAPPLGVREFFVTGGEPFILPDIAEIVIALAAVAPVTLLTNGMLFKGSRLAALRALPRDRVTLQISLDSPTPGLHDRHRGAGAWLAAWSGIQLAREEGFRVRLAASVWTDEDEEAFRQFLDAGDVPAQDRVIRRIACRGLAQDGVPVSRADLVPELTITSDGVFWHPVGAEDEDLLLTPEIFPLQAAFDRAREAVARERAFGDRLARVFNCA